MIVLKVSTPGYEFVQIEIDNEGYLTAYSLECSIVTRKIFDLSILKFGLKLADWNLTELMREGELTGLDSRALYRSQLLLNELVLKSTSRWSLPYSGQVVCACRQVSAESIDQSVAAGAKTVEQITAWTTACSSCTSCRFKIEDIIKNRTASLGGEIDWTLKKGA